MDIANLGRPASSSSMQIEDTTVFHEDASSSTHVIDSETIPHASHTSHDDADDDDNDELS